MPAKTLEARIAALEKMLHGNPGTFTKSDGVSLKEHLETRLEAMEKATEAARAGMEKRLEGMNEFRDTLRDQAARFVTQADLKAAVEASSARISALERSESRAEGKASQNSVIALFVFSLINTALAIISLFSK